MAREKNVPGLDACGQRRVVCHAVRDEGGVGSGPVVVDLEGGVDGGLLGVSDVFR